MTNQNYPSLESLVVTAEGRITLGEMAATESLTSLIAQQIALMDISEEWRLEIESARLAKLREMAQKDGEASLLLSEADPLLEQALREYAETKTAQPEVVKKAPEKDKAPVQNNPEPQSTADYDFSGPSMS